MDPIYVRDPAEMPWAVGVPLLPWRPRWRGPGRPGPTATSDTVGGSGTRVGLDIGGELAGRILLRRPFAVVAVAADGRRRQWKIRGLGAARTWAPSAADDIRVGAEPVPPA